MQHKPSKGTLVYEVISLRSEKV